MGDRLVPNYEYPRGRRRPRTQRAVFLLATAGLVVGSLVAVTGTTAATVGQAASVGVKSLGSASHLQTGQLTRALQTTSAAAFGVKSRAPSRVSTSHQQLPNLHRTRVGARPLTNSTPVPFPTASCIPQGPACDSISSSTGAITNRNGLAATANGGLYGFDIEPPDQGLCVGNGYVLESINIGEIRVFNAALAPLTSDTTLDALMGLTGLGWSSAGDPMCQYDAAEGGHWFITEIVSTTSEANGGAFAPNSCFFGGPDACREAIAVSTTANPTATSWNVYFVDPNTISPTDPGAGQLLNDYAKTATTRDAFLMFYDEFNLGTLPSGPCPGTFGCFAFNGAQQLAIQKSALELGYAHANLVHENMGTDPSIQPPDGSCNSGPTAGLTCWFQVIPASSPSSSEFNNNYGGSGFMVATTDFQAFEVPPLPPSSGDNRAAVFFWRGLSNLNSFRCGACGGTSFGGQLFTGLKSYIDNGESCPASAGNPCGLGPQKTGTLDLGTYCKLVGAASQPCPESGLATNGDGATQATYSAGQIWFAVSTLISQKFGSASEIHMGAVYYVVGTKSFTGVSPTLTLTSQGYAAAAHEDLEFPTLVGGIGAAGSVMSFTLSGNGGPTGADGGGFFPSSAYGRVTTTSGGLAARAIGIVALGAAPQDGFTEYQPYPAPFGTRPRWGDYGAAVYVPGIGFYFASEYIQFPNCVPAYWNTTDRSCGGTRDPAANFGTSLNRVG
jgi:hypothetical protein